MPLAGRVWRRCPEAMGKIGRQALCWRLRRSVHYRGAWISLDPGEHPFEDRLTQWSWRLRNSVGRNLPLSRDATIDSLPRMPGGNDEPPVRCANEESDARSSLGIRLPCRVVGLRAL